MRSDLEATADNAAHLRQQDEIERLRGLAVEREAQLRYSNEREETHADHIRGGVAVSDCEACQADANHAVTFADASPVDAPVGVLERRIEEMTADQPAIRADERARIAAEIEAQAATWDDKAVGMSSDTASSIRLGAALIRSVAALVRGKSAAASSLPGLSVCVAQLAAIRQLHHAWGEINWVDQKYPDEAEDKQRDLWFHMLAVLDGVPGTTQPDEPR